MMKYVFYIVFFALCLFAEENKEYGADYLIITPEDFFSDLLPLVSHREQQGYKCKIVTTKQIFEKFGDGRFSNYAIKKYLRDTQNWVLPPRYVVLAADACEDRQASFPSIPTWLMKTSYDEKTASDFPYVPMKNDLPSLVIGRLPCRTKSQIKMFVNKIIQYEQKDIGMWQRKIHFIAGQGYFGEAADAFCEFMFKNVLHLLMPRYYQISMTYGNPNSPYYYPAKRFPEIVTQKINEGALFFVYIGHGSWNSFGDIVDKNRKWSIFTHKNIYNIDTEKGKAFMVSIACSTSFFDHPTATSIGENLVLHPQGPISFIGSSRISHPYPNALFGKSFLEGIQKKEKNIGDLLLFVQKDLIQEKFSFLRFTIDNGAKLFAGSDNNELSILRRDQLYLYSILGDPATKIKYPKDLEVQVKEIQQNILEVSWATEEIDNEYSFEVTLETPLGKIQKEIVVSQNEENIIQNHIAANDSVIVRLAGIAQEKSKTILLSIPHNIAAGEYYCKVAIETPQGMNTGYQQFIVVKKNDN